MHGDSSEVTAIVQRLELEPHPEGGYYRQTWRAETSEGQRPTGTAIYYLLGPGDASAWHRIDATEIWHHYDGGPLEMQLSSGDNRQRTRTILGPDTEHGQQPQIIVPAGTWQMAQPLDGYVLAGCTVSPGFEFSGWELAEDGWQPGDQSPSASR